MRDTTIIIPTFNEEPNIIRLIPRLRKLYPGVRIIVADDGSMDKTQELVGKMSNSYVKLLDRSARVKGLTASVLDAAKLVKTPKLVVMDADFQHPPEKVGEIAKGLDDAEMVIGTRDSTPGWSLARKLMSGAGTLLGRLRLWVSNAPLISDPMSGFFGVRTPLLLGKVESPGFVKEGFKVLFDLVKQLPDSTKVKRVNYTFGLRRAGESKISKRHIACMLKSLFS